MQELRVKTNKSLKEMLIDRMIKLAVKPYKKKLKDFEGVTTSRDFWKHQFEEQNKKYMAVQAKCKSFEARYKKLRDKK